MTHTLKNERDGRGLEFHLIPGSKTIAITATKGSLSASFRADRESARRHWDECIESGFAGKTMRFPFG